MLGKFKSFFTPVKGGHQDGYTFKKFISSPQRIVPPLVGIGLLTAVFVEGKESFGEPAGYYGSIAFCLFILAVYTFKTLQHWNDLKNHTSR